MSLASKSVKDDIVNTNTLSHFGDSDLSTITSNNTITTWSQDTPNKKTPTKTKDVCIHRKFDIFEAIKRHVNALLLTDNAKWLRREDMKTLSSPT